MGWIAVAYCVHDDVAFLEVSVDSFRDAGPVFVFVSHRSWSGDVGCWEKAAELARALGATVVEGDWDNETDQRRFAYKYLQEQGAEYCLVPDTDEVVQPTLLQALLKVAETKLADRVYVEMDTYWKSAEFVIRPRERLAPVLLINLEVAKHVHIRHFEGGRGLTLGHEHGVLHHLSYAGTDERIQRKISTWSHKHEVVHNWYSSVWKGWDANPMMQNLHPTHPEAYGFVERIPVPPILAKAHTVAEAHEIEVSMPAISIVIPVYGAAEDLRHCLQHLEGYRHLLHQVIVIDNGSPDHALEVAKSFDFVTLIENSENRGFAGASNQGIDAATGEFVLFLNSDAYMTEIGLRAMVRSIQTSGSVAATGPYSNNVGHFQHIPATYMSLETMPLFADMYASLERPDVETDMLVGFCMLVRKSVLDEIGGFDERFGLGTFEDNDLCYRIRRAGYRMLISGAGFVHHEGSKTILNVIKQPAETLDRNQAIYVQKWKDDLQLGYVTSLPGLGPERIQFNDQRKPEVVREHFRKLAKQARISLCMIVKNEERVLGDCLSSVEPFFFEKIVVDTGSTDRTKEITLEHGAELHEFPWVDSFSAARNESLKHATGDWIFWMDADDTLPLASGEAILQAALNAPPEIHGFVVPVQFVEEGTNAGTRVDHVKLFRRYPDLQFSHRIHEQILPSLNQHEGQIARCDAVVLHSGYDTSVEGQERKRERDHKLLNLDLEEHPDHPFVLFNLGMTDHFLGEHESAIKWLTRSIEVAQGAESHIRKAYALKAMSVRELHGPEPAILVLEEGLKAVGWDPELWFHLGMTNNMIGQHEQAIAAYEMVFSEQATSFYTSYDVAITGHKTLYNLAAVYLQIGDYARSRDLWFKALETTPNFTPSAFSLFDAALEQQDFKTAQQCLEHVKNIEGFSESYLTMLERLSMQTLGPEGTRARLEQAVREANGGLISRLALARFLLGQGWEADAFPHLQYLASVGIAEAWYLMGVFEIRRGRLGQAKELFEEALSLNPGHEQTLKQLDGLARMMESSCTT